MITKSTHLKSAPEIWVSRMLHAVGISCALTLSLGCPQRSEDPPVQMVVDIAERFGEAWLLSRNGG